MTVIIMVSWLPPNHRTNRLRKFTKRVLRRQGAQGVSPQLESNTVIMLFSQVMEQFITDTTKITGTINAFAGSPNPDKNCIHEPMKNKRDITDNF